MDARLNNCNNTAVCSSASRSPHQAIEDLHLMLSDGIHDLLQRLGTCSDLKCL